MRQYSAVSTESAASSPWLQPLLSGDTITITLVTKPSLLLKQLKLGHASIISQMVLGEQGCKRYTILVGSNDEPRIRKLECRPISLSVDTLLELEEENNMRLVVQVWATKFFNIEVDSCTVESYNEPGCVLFYPSSKGDYIYVTDDERLLVDINLNDFVGKEIISSHALAAAALEEVILPTSQEIDGMYVFDYGVRNALSEYTVTDILRGIEGATNLLDEYGDMYVERHDSRYDLIVELCTAWSIDYEEWGGGIYIYRGQLNPVDIRDAVREILLNHPGMFRTTNKDIRSTSSTEEYKKDIREWGDIQSIPMWSLKDMFQDKEVLRTGLPEAEIAVDLTGAMVMYPDGSKELIRVRQRSDPGTAQEYLTILKELCDRVWKQGGFVSRWGKHMWEHYGIRSVFFTRTPPVFDTMRDAIAYLEKLVKIKEKE